MRRRSLIVSAVVLSAVAIAPSVFGIVASTRADDFESWVMTRGQILSARHSGDEALPVGSLQKPFLVRAWASSHPTTAIPSHACTRTSGCWRPGGHGVLDLRVAIRESCNTYFRRLAAETPRAAIDASFRDAGFQWTGEMTEAETIGLPGFARVRVAPNRLLPAFDDLVRRPWQTREDVRQEMLLGLKDAAEQGTASGGRLWGFMGKTGTVPALDGTPLKTSGFALLTDGAGFGLMGLLPKGTGREAAIRAGVEIAKLRPDVMRRSVSAAPRPIRTPAPKRGLEDPIRVAMLEELRLTDVRLLNRGSGPADSTRGFVGPGAETPVAPGDRFGASLWEIRATKPLFERRVRGSLEASGGEGPIRLIATMTARDYADGVLKAELGSSLPEVRVSLAAATLRFVRGGARHADADVCDSTHCAWFVGEGPVPRWIRPDRAIQESVSAAPLTDGEWSQAVSRARGQPAGPALWTADCGGDPVSPHFIWGGGDRRVVSCARHPKGSGRVWRREWKAADVAKVFGVQPSAIDVVVVDGQWFLNVTAKAASDDTARSNRSALSLTYDDAHRRLAAQLGWDALPAPATRVTRTAGGFIAEGVGFGHRTGLCLAP